jgi:hypothetical protein
MVLLETGPKKKGGKDMRDTANLSGPSKLKRLIDAIGIVSALCLVSACKAAPAQPTVGTNNSVAISTFTAMPTAISQTSAPTLEPTQNSGVIGRLPGLSAVNVTVSLEQREFTCTAVKKAVAYYERSCTKGVPPNVLHVVISGREPFIVDFIETSVLQSANPDNKAAIELMGLVATMAYDGATPEDAKAWVESTIPALSGEAQEVVFGGVKYVLYGPPTALTLEMGELP